MTKEKWQEILNQNEVSDILTEESWNEDAPIPISLLVSEIREIGKLVDTAEVEKKIEKLIWRQPMMLEKRGNLFTSIVKILNGDSDESIFFKRR